MKVARRWCTFRADDAGNVACYSIHARFDRRQTLRGIGQLHFPRTRLTFHRESNSLWSGNFPPRFTTVFFFEGGRASNPSQRRIVRTLVIILDKKIPSFNFLQFFPSRNFSIPFHSNQTLRKKVNERYAEKKERKRYLLKQEANQELNVRFHQTNDDQKINRYYRNRNGVYNRNTRRGELLTRLTFEIRNVHDEARACMINDCMGNLEGAIRTLAWLRRGHKPEAAIQGPGRARCE